jgi:ABC-2 type transport system ATP-binding protein
MPEVEDLCNRVAIIRSGRIAYEGSLDELRSRAGITYRLRTTDDELARRICAAQAELEQAESDGSAGLRFKARSEGAVGAFSLALAEAGAAILELTPRQASLEEVFFQLTEEATPAAGAPPRHDKIEAAA